MVFNKQPVPLETGGMQPHTEWHAGLSYKTTVSTTKQHFNENVHSGKGEKCICQFEIGQILWFRNLEDKSNFSAMFSHILNFIKRLVAICNLMV